MPRRRTILMSALALAGCATAPAAEPLAHEHRQATTVVVTLGALLPDPVARIPEMATVVWHNRTGVPLSLRVHGAPCPPCDTVLGFRQEGDGASCAAVAPGSVATLCFHEVGSFAYEAKAGAAIHRGTVVVEGAP